MKTSVSTLRQAVTNTKILLSLVIAVFFCMNMAGCTTNSAAGTKRETALSRVIRTGKIRCSYVVYSSYFRKEPATGKLSGIFHDIMEEIGKNAGLKIDWAEEVGFQNIFPGLEADRVDVYAGGLWPNASRAKAASFSGPAFYSAITAWGRPGDLRFDKDLSLINSPSIKIATIDGAMEDLISKTDFPKAQRVSLTELSPFVQNLLNVTTKKADVTFAEPMVIAEYLRTNPGALRQIAPDKPLRIFGNCFAVKTGEIELRDFLDEALKEIVQNGQVDKILAKYEPSRGTFYPLAKPYTLTK